MRTSVAIRLLGLAAAALAGAGGAWAAVQGTDPVYWLGTGDWQLREEAGGAYLVRCPLPRRDWLDKDKRCAWRVSAPTIRSPAGKYLAGAPDDRTPSVGLVADKRAGTRWVFEFVERFAPGPSKEERGRFKEGRSGFAFRVKLDEGPFKGWYLAAGERAAEAEGGKGPARRPLQLVRTAREATIFTYVETNHFVDHK
jgi:hypothetical protein